MVRPCTCKTAGAAVVVQVQGRTITQDDAARADGPARTDAYGRSIAYEGAGAIGAVAVEPQFICPSYDQRDFGSRRIVNDDPVICGGSDAKRGQGVRPGTGAVGHKP